MELNYANNNIHHPFSLLRLLIPELDSLANTNWTNSILSRAVFHRMGRENESLSERQTPISQLRYYTKHRVLRGLRRIALDYSSKINENITLKLTEFPAEPDREFLNWFGLHIDLKVEIIPARQGDKLLYDKHSERLELSLNQISNGTFSIDEISTYLNQLLSYGDSWSAKQVASSYLQSVNKIDISLTDVLGIPYALQGDTGMANLLWEQWAKVSAIEEARARYSLSMLYARHHPQALLDLNTAESHLEIAWEKLQMFPSNPAVNYERIFNRNGLSLLLFRKGKYTKARAVLEDGISQLQNTEYEGTLHHTVLVSNLAHVIHLIGDFTEAEKLYRQAISMDPMFAEYHQDLASFLCDMQRMDEALKEIECALKLDPSMSEAWRLCGYILMHLGKPRKARDCYSEAVSLGDNLGIIDALRASYEADSPEWTILFGSKYRDFVIDAPSQVELELLILHARSKTDPFFDFRKALKVLQSSFPDDELINLAIKANT